MLFQPQAPPDAITPTIIEVVKDPVRPLSMVDVVVASFGLIGVIIGAAVVAGLLAGALYIWYRSKHAVSTIEAQGHEHNLFRVH